MLINSGSVPCSVSFHTMNNRSAIQARSWLVAQHDTDHHLFGVGKPYSGSGIPPGCIERATLPGGIIASSSTSGYDLATLRVVCGRLREEIGKESILNNGPHGVQSDFCAAVRRVYAIRHSPNRPDVQRTVGESSQRLW